MCFLPLMVWYLQGLLAPVIAILATYIAYQQWQTNAKKSKLDLFDRRFRVFEETRKILGMIYTSGVSDEQLLRFTTETAEADFLFGPEIREYMDEIYRRVTNHSSAKKQMSVSWQAPVEVRAKLAETIAKEVTWALNETRMVAEKFKGDLDISKL